MWIPLSIGSKFGPISKNRFYVGLLLVSLLALPCFSQSSPLSGLTVTVGEIPEMPQPPAEPTGAPESQEKIPENQTDKQLISLLSKQLSVWITWSTDYKTWRKMEKAWILDLTTWWAQAKSLWKRQIEDRDSRIANLTFENALLKAQLKDADGKMLAAGIGGAGGGALLVLILSAVLKK